MSNYGSLHAVNTFKYSAVSVGFREFPYQNIEWVIYVLLLVVIGALADETLGIEEECIAA